METATQTAPPKTEQSSHDPTPSPVLEGTTSNMEVFLVVATLIFTVILLTLIVL